MCPARPISCGTGGTSLGIDIRFLPVLLLAACGADPIADTTDDSDTDTDTIGTTLPTYTTPIQICINEVMTENTGALQVDGDWPDWIELHNPTAAQQSLENWLVHDEDGSAFRLDASSSVPAGGFLLLYASELDLPGHLPFKLNNSGDSVVLVRPDESFIRVNIPGGAADWSYARETDCCVGDCWVAELWGTPGETNEIPEP